MPSLAFYGLCSVAMEAIHSRRRFKLMVQDVMNLPDFWPYRGLLGRYTEVK